VALVTVELYSLDGSADYKLPVDAGHLFAAVAVRLASVLAVQEGGTAHLLPYRLRPYAEQPAVDGPSPPLPPMTDEVCSAVGASSAQEALLRGYQSPEPLPSEMRFFTIELYRGEKVAISGTYEVREALEACLECRVRQWLENEVLPAEKAPFTFRLTPDADVGATLYRGACETQPDIEAGAFTLDDEEEDEDLEIVIRDVEVELPTVSPRTDYASLALVGQQSQRHEVPVLVSREVYQFLSTASNFSTRVEEGGVLVGRLTRNGDSSDPEARLLEVSHAVAADRGVATAGEFGFTPEAWRQVRDAVALEHRPEGREIVGWYHTHVVNPQGGAGLSNVDVQLHDTWFRDPPWQVALLTTLVGGVLVSVFQRDIEGKLANCGFYVYDPADAPDTPAAKADPL